ncbi:MAG: helix-turn-helix domain-containing protein [Lentisphaeria bacterium]|nr:MAG: helix-turn-helix domain-containing protein [Lentisphaeria bacterium]
MSGNYVSQLFARHMHCGFSEYLTGQRLELARRLLLHSDLNVGEIASCCGFRHANYFIRVFRGRFHCTPLHYRGNAAALRGADEEERCFFGNKFSL